MVYSFFKKFHYSLQFNCLLCGIECKKCSSGIFGLCQFCHAQLPHLALEHCCEHCSLPLAETAHLLSCGRCLQAPPSYDGSCCALSYEDDSIELIQRLKRQFDNAHIRLLAQLLAQKIQQQNNWHTLWPSIDKVIPSPMYLQRNLSRGNDHSRLLTQALCKTLKLPIDHKTVIRSKYSLPQKGLTAKQRQKNIQGVFSVISDVRGQHIAITDDVMTTGATMNEIAICLKQAGAEKVYAWSVARTPYSLK